MFFPPKSHVDNVIYTFKFGQKLTSVDPVQTAPIRFNQGLHYLQTSSASFAYTS